MYYKHGTGLTRVFLQIEPDSNKEGRGYYRILGHFAKPGDVNIPPYYSYAKYNRGRLASYKGTYPYPNKYAFDFGQDDDYAVNRTKKHTHFIKRISDEEMIVISRPQRNIMTFCVAFSYLFLILMLFTMLLTSGKKRTKAFKNNYFKTKINTILFVSSFLILASMTAVSIIFVYQRNESNMFGMMASRITTVQTLLESYTRHTRDWQELLSTDFDAELDNIGNIIKSDISPAHSGGKSVPFHHPRGL